MTTIEYRKDPAAIDKLTPEQFAVIPVDELESRGYGDYLSQFETAPTITKEA